MIQLHIPFELSRALQNPVISILNCQLATPPFRRVGKKEEGLSSRRSKPSLGLRECKSLMDATTCNTYVFLSICAIMQETPMYFKRWGLLK